MGECEIGFVVVEFNQASHQPSIPNAVPIEDRHQAEITKLYYEHLTRKSGRRERYVIGTVTIEEED